MIKWHIKDKQDELNERSESVKIGNKKFMFYATRSSSEYRGIKIFTSLVPCENLDMHQSRNSEFIKSNSAP